MRSTATTTEDRAHELADAVTLAAQIHENGVDGVAVYDRDLQFCHWSPEMQAVSGIPRAEALHRTAYELHPGLREAGEDCRLLEALNGCPQVSAVPFFPAPRSLRPGAWQFIYQPLHARSGRIVGGVVIARNRLEHQELRRRLARAHAELEKFAYVAAHDLRAPLRALEHLTAWTAEELADLDAAALSERLATMRQRIDRMDRLLTALLAYARAGVEVPQIKRVDVAALVWGVVTELTVKHPGFKFVVDQPMPVLDTAQLPLLHVVRHLLHNAVRHHDRPDGQVAVRSMHAGGFWELTVVDDGPGIPADVQSKVFEIFQTLRPRDEVEANGMGLALVRRIVERGGGVLRLESPVADGRGTLFRFTWPAEWPRSD